MIEKKDIQPIIDNYTAGAGLFLVALKISVDNVVEVVIDGPQGVNLDQCVALSNRINAAFDRNVEDFELTVSSAGLDQPLRVFPQYLKYIGQEVEITLKAGTKKRVTLLDATPEAVTVQYVEQQKVADKKRKQPVIVTETYILTEVKTTKPIIKWKD
ncbi:MAG: ribosome assembly cofactor RimP [Prevotellaceae bacterium]|jgi:ribosome maturation factor RimP|nr:ribosome assembly cofactor RimP [Prevotellaceae bacterium]